MCGITGIYAPQMAEKEGLSLAISQRVTQMANSLSLRGPDGNGIFVSDSIALGHVRLSILDTSSAGAQPMSLSNTGLTISYNGECYNFRELRQELQSLGCVFSSGSDTEVILKKKKKWGLQGLKRLEGIFALALWDASNKRLILMRDRLGVKPLYYGESIFGLAFGSEIKAVLAAGCLDTSINDQSLSEYMWFGNTHQDRSFYTGISQLEPGHWLIFEEGHEAVLEPWWQIEEWLDNPLVSSDKSSTTIQVRDTLDLSVNRQLVSDVPIGLFLSGGIDSSAIAGSVGNSRVKHINTFAAEFDFSGNLSELSKAALIAKIFDLSHNEIKIYGHDMPSVIHELAKAHDEPFADAANLALYAMCKELPDHIKVVLQGDGGDELFGGYRRYAILRNAKLWRMCPRSSSSALYSLGSNGRRLSRMIDTLGCEDPAVMMALLLTMESPRLPPERFFTPEKRNHLRNTTDPFLAYRFASKRFKDYDIVQKMLLTDLTTQLPSQFLHMVDRATMASGIEARVPFLDENLVKLAINIPSIWKARGVQKKIILRDSQRLRLPGSILDSPKAGFGVPYQQWLRTSLYEFAKEKILDVTTVSRWDLDVSVVEKALKEHKSGKFDHGFMLWKILQLALFQPYIQSKVN